MPDSGLRRKSLAEWTGLWYNLIMSYDCVNEEHEKCDDSKVDTYVCSCGCHLFNPAPIDIFGDKP